MARVSGQFVDANADSVPTELTVSCFGKLALQGQTACRRQDPAAAAQHEEQVVPLLASTMTETRGPPSKEETLKSIKQMNQRKNRLADRRYKLTARHPARRLVGAVALCAQNAASIMLTAQEIPETI